MSLLPMICLILLVLFPRSTFLDKAYSNIFLHYIWLIFFSSVKYFSQNNLDFQKRVKKCRPNNHAIKSSEFRPVCDELTHGKAFEACLCNS